MAGDDTALAPAATPPVVLPFPFPAYDPEHAHEDNLPWILAVLGVVHALAIIVVVCRLYVKVRLVKSIGADDWTITGAVLCALGGYIIFIIQGINGLGRHIYVLDQRQMQAIEQGTFWQSVVSSSLGIALLKSSIALNLMRLSPGGWYTGALWASLVLVCAYSFLGMMTFFLHCDPMRGHWDHGIGATCYSIDLFIVFALLNTSFNIFTDVLFATFPVPVIWRLQMKMRVRFYLIGILSLGYIAVIMGALKAESQINFDVFGDNTFNSWVTFWAGLQINIGIIAACAPSLKPLVTKALKLSSFRSRYGYGSRYGNSRATATIGGGISGGGGGGGGSGAGPSQNRRSRFNRDNYAMEELGSESGKQSDEVQFSNRGGNSTASATFYRGTGDSDEMIWNSGPAGRDIKGIVRTTEVIVK